MAGRGRGKTLPAWMTNSELGAQASAQTSSNETGVTASQSADQFHDPEPSKASIVDRSELLALAQTKETVNSNSSSSSNNTSSGSGGTFSQHLQQASSSSSAPPSSLPHSIQRFGGDAAPATVAAGLPYHPSAQLPFNSRPGPPQFGAPPQFGGPSLQFGGVNNGAPPQQQYGGPPTFSQPPPFMHVGGQMPRPLSFMPPPTFPGAGGFVPRPIPGMLPIAGYPVATHPANAVSMGMGMHMQQPMSGMPIGISGTGSTPSAISDPNNDVSCWTEHEKDQRKFWYNRTTGMSTYDKPFCLKTPEERSIPPCLWKEYSQEDGKKYYSDGKESSWTMPEEFRLWKERIDAIEKKKNAEPEAPSSTTTVPALPPMSLSSSSAALENLSGTDQTIPDNGAADHQQQHQEASSNGSASNAFRGTDNEEDASLLQAAPQQTSAIMQPQAVAHPPPVVVAAPVYATHAEAVEAFKAMLEEHDVTAVMKMKEVIDLCQKDVRFNALKGGGEKKQALAEYQTKRLKMEKEVQKNRARRHRDAFLLMLAENTEIDARTRWRTAIDILQDDARYKNVEDPNDREDLFNDFVQELEKKEREDRSSAKKKASQLMEAILEAMKAKGDITRRTIWADCKRELVEKTSGPEFKALDDIEVRRCFQDFVDRLDAQYREEERIKREELQRKVDTLAADFRNVLEKLAFSGVLTAFSRWKDCNQMPEITNTNAFRKLEAATGGWDKSGGASGPAGVSGNTRDVFEKVIGGLRESHRLDKRLVRTVLDAIKFTVKHDTSLEEVRAAISAAADPKEDGEEVEESSGFSKQVRAMFAQRPSSLGVIFGDMMEQAKVEHAEEVRKQRKKEERFVEKLEDYFYRSDHVDVTWEEAKQVLSKHSAYDALSEADRKQIFTLYMEQLAKKLDAKTKAMQTLLGSSATDADKERKDHKDHSTRDRDRDGGKGRDRGGSSKSSPQQHNTTSAETATGKHSESDPVAEAASSSSSVVGQEEVVTAPPDTENSPSAAVASRKRGRSGSHADKAVEAVADDESPSRKSKRVGHKDEKSTKVSRKK